MMRSHKLFVTCILISGILALASLAQAQDVQAPPSIGVTRPDQSLENAPPEVIILRQIEADLKEKYKKEIYIPPAIQSLIFTPSQEALIREARSGFNTKTESEEKKENAPVDLQAKSLAVRSLALSGIVFINPDDWTIWLNKSRITPAKLPREAVDLRVYKDFIELRWLDLQTNKIFPIRLRPNQTFNLDAQTFVPG